MIDKGSDETDSEDDAARKRFFEEEDGRARSFIMNVFCDLHLCKMLVYSFSTRSSTNVQMLPM